MFPISFCSLNVIRHRRLTGIHNECHELYDSNDVATQIAKFMGPTWGPPGYCRPQMGPFWPQEPCYQGIHDLATYRARSARDIIRHKIQLVNYNDVIMSAMASQITSLTIVYSTVYSRRRSKKTSKLFFTGLGVWRIHRWPVNSPHKWPVTHKKAPFDDVIMFHGNSRLVAQENICCNSFKLLNWTFCKTRALIY